MIIYNKIKQLIINKYLLIYKLFNVLIILFTMHCASTNQNYGNRYEGLDVVSLNRRIKKINSDNMKNSHGYIIINPNFKNHTIDWRITFVVNNKIYFHKAYFDYRGRYKVVIPDGKLTIEYEILDSGLYRDEYTTNVGIFGNFRDWKTIELTVEKDQSYQLDIILINKDVFGIGLISGGSCAFPWLKYYHEVAFKVKKVDDEKTEDSDKNDLK